jgi:hypothetical protein
MAPLTLSQVRDKILIKELTGHEEMKVVGVRTFDSDESWMPVRDYPEFSKDFGISGRQQIEMSRKQVELGLQRNKKAFYVLAGSVLAFFAFCYLLWIRPFVDASNSAGEAQRMKEQVSSLAKSLDASKEQSQQRVGQLESAIRTQEDALRKREAEIEALDQRLRERQQQLNDAGAALVRSESSVRDISERLASAESELKRLRAVPRVWPGAESLRPPAGINGVKLVSMKPEGGWIYVISTERHPDGTVLELRERGNLGMIFKATVSASYVHNVGSFGLSLKVDESTGGTDLFEKLAVLSELSARPVPSSR